MAGEQSKRSEHSRGVFLSWARSNRRSTDIAADLGLDTKFVSIGKQRAATAPFRWLAQGVASLPAIAHPRTSAIVLMLPPYPALVVCRAIARVRKIPLIIDAHSAVFEDSRFERFLPATIKALRRSDMTIVTNERHRSLLESHDVAVTVLHNPPAALTALEGVDPNGHVLIPASWHADEPIAALIEVARSRPDVSFAITGSPAPAVRAAIDPVPANVRLTGFVSDEEYGTLLDTAAAVCCLTLNDNTMQMGGYEALGKGLPLITSDFGLLRDYFGDAAEYTAPHAESIGRAIDNVFADVAGRSERMHLRRRELLAGYDASLEPIRAILDR